MRTERAATARGREGEAESTAELGPAAPNPRAASCSHHHHLPFPRSWYNFLPPSANTEGHHFGGPGTKALSL